MIFAAQLALLVFGAIAFGGTGAAIALARHRRANEARADNPMFGLAAVLGAFAVMCTTAAAGWTGVLAVGGAAVFASYVMTARKIGLFEIERGPVPDLAEATPEHR